MLIVLLDLLDWLSTKLIISPTLWSTKYIVMVSLSHVESLGWLDGSLCRESTVIIWLLPVCQCWLWWVELVLNWDCWLTLLSMVHIVGVHWLGVNSSGQVTSLIHFSCGVLMNSLVNVFGETNCCSTLLVLPNITWVLKVDFVLMVRLSWSHDLSDDLLRELFVINKITWLMLPDQFLKICISVHFLWFQTLPEISFIDSTICILSHNFLNSFCV